MAVHDAEALLATLIERMRPAISVNETALVGIHTGGVWVAERLHRALRLKQPMGTIDVAFYRDDFEHRGLKSDVRPSALPFDVDGADIVLVDDVLYTGRTIRAALNTLFDYGRPRIVRLAALLDRGERQLPIAPQFVGGNVSVPPGSEIVLVHDAVADKLSLIVKEREDAK